MILCIISKNYFLWFLCGWFMVRFVGFFFEEDIVLLDDLLVWVEILLLFFFILVFSFYYGDVLVWDMLVIVEYFNEICFGVKLLLVDFVVCVYCCLVCGEMYLGFLVLCVVLLMNFKGYFFNFKVWFCVEVDIVCIIIIWKECLVKYGGFFLFGEQCIMVDVMYVFVVMCFMIYDVKFDFICIVYVKCIMVMLEMQEWIIVVKKELEDIDELDVEFQGVCSIGRKSCVCFLLQVYGGRLQKGWM